MGDEETVAANDLILYAVIGLGVSALILAGVAGILFLRHQGHFYRVKGRSTLRSTLLE